MPLLNPDFSEVGVGVGQAAHWTLVAHVAARRQAGFGPAPERGAEDFERWSPLVRAFPVDSVVHAIFAGQSVEGFESGWLTSGYATAFPTQAVAAIFDAADHDAFSWTAQGYLTSWPTAAEQAASFDGDAQDDFEGWSPSYETSFDSLGAAAAEFDGTGVEHFSSWPQLPV